MSDRKDLTRWNRAGQTRFRYVDGKAGEYLEILRARLVENFKDPKTGRCEWLTPAEKVLANEKKPEGKTETLLERQERLSRKQERVLEMYRQDPRAVTWEITRTFARACHILTEHVDAYANEGYLGTATQWDHVRRLVEMLDYHPAPPASASTRLVLEAKASVSGLVKKGWQVKYKPPDGGDTVIFETLDDIEVDSALNQLYPKDWDKSQKHLSETVTWATKKGDDIEALKISGGDVGVLLHTAKGEGKVVHLADVDHATGKLTFSTPGLTNADSWPEHQVELRIGAKDVRSVRLNGEGVVGFDAAPGLSAGDVISWFSSGRRFNEVVEADGKFVRLTDPSTLPGPGDPIYRLNRIGRTTLSSFPYNSIIFPLAYDHMVVRENRVLRLGTSGDRQEVKTTDEGEESLYYKIKGDSITEIYVGYSTEQPLDVTVTQVAPTDFSTDGVLRDFVVDGAPKGLRSGDWIVGAGGGNRFALQIESIEEREEDFICRFLPFQVDQSASPLVISESLGTVLRKIQVALDEDVLRDKTLGYFIDGRAKALGVQAIQDIGKIYAGKFPAGTTLQDLMEMTATTLPGISETRLRQFKTKAEMVLRIQVTEEARSLSNNLVYALLKSLASPGATVLPAAAPPRLDRIYGPMQYTLHPKDYNRNGDYLPTGTDITLKTCPSSLKPGHTVLVKCGSHTLLSEVQEIPHGNTVRLVNKVDAKTFIKADTRLYANVVLAGHGEKKPAKILGSGDATKSHQSFTLEVKDVSFTADATKHAGVAAAIEVEVAGRLWEQVSTLKDSGSEDPHYAVRMTEEGTLKILFGDGQYGRRLPSGRNNVKVAYRVGSGLSGNAPAGGLEKPVKPHALIKAVQQPIKAAGAGDMEDMTSLKDNAPATLLALERAVSLSDFSHLAASQSSVWQAKAFGQILHGGRTESVRLVIVPADGVKSDETLEAIRSFLQRHALPGVQVTVEDYEEACFNLSITVRVRLNAFVAEEVEKAVTSALADTFTLKNRKLGANLYLSEVTKVVEAVQGVENSTCILNGDEAKQLIQAENESTVVCLDTDAGSTLTVTAEEYLP